MPLQLIIGIPREELLCHNKHPGFPLQTGPFLTNCFIKKPFHLWPFAFPLASEKTVEKDCRGMIFVLRM